MKEASAKKKKKLFESTEKVVYETDSEELLIQEFKDEGNFNGGKTAKIKSKGVVSNQVSAHMFTYLDSYHVPTHFVKTHSNNAMLVKKLDMIPVEVMMRNIATGNMVERYGVEDGKELERPILEYYLKDDDKKDPMVNDHHILAFEYASAEELKQMERLAHKINAILKSFFYRRRLLLVDFKVEFGRNKSGKLTLGDEISPGTCSFWDSETGEKLAKGKDASAIEQVYAEVRKRVFKD